MNRQINCCVFLALLLVSIQLALAAEKVDEDSDGVLIRHRRQSNALGPALFRSLRPCCFWPNIIGRYSYDNCHIKANSSSTVIYDRMCLVDCAMKNASLILNGTRVNYGSIGIRFARAAGISFPTTALQAVADCSTYVENFNGTIPTPAPPTGITTCSPKAALAWICIRQKFILNTCARTAAQEESCAANFAKLKALTPLDLLNAA